MTLQELKQALETNTFKPTTMILISEDKFIPLQYVEEMKKQYNVMYIDSLQELLPNEDDIFEDSTEISSDIIIFNTIPKLYATLYKPKSAFEHIF